jgi:hypothetical protein
MMLPDAHRGAILCCHGIIVTQDLMGREGGRITMTFPHCDPLPCKIISARQCKLNSALTEYYKKAGHVTPRSMMASIVRRYPKIGYADIVWVQEVEPCPT